MVPGGIVRIFLDIHNAYTDRESVAAHRLRILMKWMAEGGHECRVLATARFDARPPDIDEHLAGLGVPLTRRPPAPAFTRSVQKPKNTVVGRPTVQFTVAGVPVTMLLTRHNDGQHPDPYESAQFLHLFDQVLREFGPDVLLTYGSHPVLLEALRCARARGVTTVFTLRNHGYDDRSYYENVDHVFTTSPYLSSLYRQKIGLISTGIVSPIDGSEVLAPADSRTFVTFVNPSAHKGVGVFARLADMLGSARPDIPILVVQSASSAGILNAIPGIDFAKYPQIMASPPLPRPADFFALTKLLLVPSLFDDPLGRVAAEAMINGIPPLVSNRGGLPETVAGAGRVLPVPERLTGKTLEVPDAEEIRMWFDAVCELWDDSAKYAAASRLARETAERLYGEPAQRQRYLDYFGSLKPDGRLFE
jgi:glycosyltransferase involved in cell wall biosynthesis